jgi:hypothetical protein
MKTPRLVGAFLFLRFTWEACVAWAGLIASLLAMRPFQAMKIKDQ